jgi:hypothetical protein
MYERFLHIIQSLIEGKSMLFNADESVSYLHNMKLLSREERDTIVNTDKEHKIAALFAILSDKPYMIIMELGMSLLYTKPYTTHKNDVSRLIDDILFVFSFFDGVVKLNAIKNHVEPITCNV